MSIQDASIRLDSIDLAIIRVMIIQRCTSAYAIWLQLKQESLDSGHEREIIVYKNVNVRLTKLVKLEYITEISPHTYTQHGRRDYKVTMKGFELLSPYIMGHPEDIQDIVEYINRFNVDKYQLGSLLLRGLTNSIETLNEYHTYTNALYFPYGITEMNEIKEWLTKYHDNFDKDKEEVHSRLTTASDIMGKNIEMGKEKYLELAKLVESLQKMTKYMTSAQKQEFLEWKDKHAPQIEKLNSDSEIEEMSKFSDGVKTSASRKKRPT